MRRALPGMVFCAASSSLPLGMADLPSMSAPTLLVADDHPLFRAAVMHVLRERLPQYAIVEAASAATLGAALQAHPEVELVLLDLAMPGARGFSVLLHVRGEYPEIPVVIISSNDHPRVIRRAQQFGAAGFIPKSRQWPPNVPNPMPCWPRVWPSSRRSSSVCCCAWPTAC